MKPIAAILAILVLFAAPALAVDPGALHRAKGFYAKGLAEYEAYHRSLDRGRLAAAIKHFKDSFTTDPNFSKSYYAIVSALEELEPGSSDTVSESLAELVDNLFDPFVTGGEAASDIASLEVLGVCLERIRTLEAATAAAREAGGNLSAFLPMRLECPSGAAYTAAERGGTVEIACPLHGRPTGPAGYAAEGVAAAKRFASPAYALYREAMALAATAALEPDAARAKADRRKAAQLFLRAARTDPNLVEAKAGYLQVAREGKLKPGELEAFARDYQRRLADPRLKRFGRLAAGDILDLEIAVRCHLQRLMTAEGVRMHMLNLGKNDPGDLPLDELLAKGYLKRRPVCPKGGRFTLSSDGRGGARVRCSVHGE